jgi:hypothetical protein
MAKQGVVNIRGKEYQTVALRVSNFRESFPQFSLVTEVLHRDVDCVVMKATISNDSGRVMATGHAEEYRKASEINRTSALENAETSAIGRALAAMGLGGTEFASADEVARAVSGAKGEAKRAGVMADVIAELPALSAEDALYFDELAQDVEQIFAEGGQRDAFERVEVEELDNEQKIQLWSRLGSKVRSALKVEKGLRIGAA